MLFSFSGVKIRELKEGEEEDFLNGESSDEEDDKA